MATRSGSGGGGFLIMQTDYAKGPKGGKCAECAACVAYAVHGIVIAAKSGPIALSSARLDREKFRAASVNPPLMWVSPKLMAGINKSVAKLASIGPQLFMTRKRQFYDKNGRKKGMNPAESVAKSVLEQWFLKMDSALAQRQTLLVLPMSDGAVLALTRYGSMSAYLAGREVVGEIKAILSHVRAANER